MKNGKVSKDFNKIGRKGTTALLSAVESDDVLAAYDLLKKGASPDTPSQTPEGIYRYIYHTPYPAGSTPLYVACLAGNTMMVDTLLLIGKADPNIRNSKDETPLDAALGNLGIYRRQLEDAERDGKSGRGLRTIKNNAAIYEKIVRRLLRHGAVPTMFSLPDDFLSPPAKKTPPRKPR